MKKVLGLGNALVDIMTSLETDVFLQEFGLAKGSMQLVDKDLSTRILKATAGLKKERASGGSAANTIHGLARLGIQSGFIGKIGKDEFGEFFRNDMKEAGISPLLYTGIDETGKAIALVSKDSERTFATFLGASIELSADDLHENDFNGYDYFYIEGYLVQNYEIVNTSVAIAKKLGMTIALDLASFNVVQQHLDFLKKLIRNNIDIVFANEEEARAFTGKDPLDAIEEISTITKMAIIKTGKDGSLIKCSDGLFRIDPVKANCIDTTGAGDSYAAGFLYGLVHELPLKICGDIGSLIAGTVIEQIGARIRADKWEGIRQRISKMI